ncbi:MAG: SRPBCC domain-containing protein [Umezawaea sp.]
MTRIEVTVAAPVDAVWEALRDKEQVRQWHGWDYHGLDDEIDQVFFADVIEEVRALRLRGGDRFTLEPDGDRTVVTLTRAPHGDDPALDAYYDDITEGWTTFLQQLRFALERQPGAVRRTLYFAGYAAAVGVPEALGLEDVTGPYSVDLVGEKATGDLWFRSANQLGVTVDGWGGGLLVVARTPPSDVKPHAAVMAVLSTYGLDEVAFADLDTRWTAWWAQRYPGD